MKNKIALLAVAVFAVMLMVSSCKVAEDCPAYGSVDTTVEESANS